MLQCVAVAERDKPASTDDEGGMEDGDVGGDFLYMGRRPKRYRSERPSSQGQPVRDQISEYIGGAGRLEYRRANPIKFWRDKQNVSSHSCP